MNLQSTSTKCDFSQILVLSPPICPCKRFNVSPLLNFSGRKKLFITHKRKIYIIQACMIPIDGGNHNLNIDIAKSTTRGAKSFVVKRLSSKLEERDLSQDSVTGTFNFTNYGEDPIVDKLRTQLGIIHPIPSPPINRNIVGLFVFFFFVGVVFDKLWTSRPHKTRRRLRRQWRIRRRSGKQSKRHKHRARQQHQLNSIPKWATMGVSQNGRR